MATNLAINNILLEQAFDIGGFRSKKDTVNNALAEFIQRRKTLDFTNLFGTIEYDQDYDYKKLRMK